MQKMNKIKIGSKTYPVKVDLNVLEIIQEDYGSVQMFERDLLGLKLVKNPDGTQKYTSDGDPEMEIVEPSIKAIRIALPAMINEGLRLESFRTKKDYTPVEADEVIADCNVSFQVLANFIHEEYKRCFETKKI